MQSPTLKIRVLSNDAYELDKCFYHNYYQLKLGNQDANKGKVLLDLGSHCGYFSYTACLAGYNTMYMVEPCLDSFSILLDNFKNMDVNFIPINSGVYTSTWVLDFKAPTFNGKFVDFSNYSYQDQGGGGISCQCYSLDDILTIFVRDNVDLLKINVNGLEDDILLTSKFLFDKVESICGEMDNDEERFSKLKQHLSNLGYIYSFSKDNPNNSGRKMIQFSKKELTETFS